MNFNQEEKEILISTWLNGNHTADIKLFPIGLFEEYAKVVDQVKNGETNIITIAKKSGFKISKLARLMSSWSDAIYQSVILTYKEQRRREELEAAVNRGASVAEYETIINQYHNDISNVPTLTPLDMAAYLDELDKRAEQINYVTGLGDLDQIISIRKGELTSVGARPSTGKSTFTLQIAKRVAKDGGKVLFMPLEMTKAQTIDRLVLGYCSEDITSKAIKSGRLSREQWGELNDVLARIGDHFNSLIVCDTVRHIEDIETLIETNKPDVVVIDQLQQMTSNAHAFSSVRERFSYMTANLKRIALEQNTAIILACQLNRSAKGTVPGLEQLKESGSIEEDSDNVIILNRDEDREKTVCWYGDTRLINCQVAKQREGATGACDLKLIPHKFTFRGIEK